MSKLILNAAPVLLEQNQSTTMDFAPAADLLVSFESNNITFPATGSYSQGGDLPQQVALGVGQVIPTAKVINGNGSNLTLRNSSSANQAMISGGIYGMGEPTNGYIQADQSDEQIGVYQSVLAITTPSWLKFRLTATTSNKETVVYLFTQGQKPQGYVLNYTGSGDTDFKTTTQNFIEDTGNWGGNPLFFINASSSDESKLTVGLVTA